MTFDADKAARYFEQRYPTTIRAADVVELVAFWQGHHQHDGAPLEVDGALGPDTLATIDEARAARAQPAAIAKVWPLRQLADGRRPQVTSGFKTRNPDRPKHNGIDLFYRYDPAVDPPVKVGDGGASRGADGKPKWWIPDREPARAAAAGKVIRASKITTGFRVALLHADGHETIYAHLRNLAVLLGQVIELGAPVGEVGDNPADLDAEHLHFEVTPAGVYAPIDPEVWLKGATYLDPSADGLDSPGPTETP